MWVDENGDFFIILCLKVVFNQIHISIIRCHTLDKNNFIYKYVVLPWPRYYTYKVLVIRCYSILMFLSNEILHRLPIQMHRLCLKML